MDEIEIFISYAEKDWSLVKELVERLQKLKKYVPSLYIWDRVNDISEQNLEQAIYRHIENAKIILLLVSPRLLKSKTYELSLIEAKRRSGTARIMPILLRPTDWSRTFFADIQPLPTNHKPISLWRPPNWAYYETVDEIENVVEEFLKENRKKDEETHSEWWMSFL